MDGDGEAFVDPLTQCPQKPRGRKKGTAKAKAQPSKAEPAESTKSKKPRGTKRQAAEQGEQVDKKSNTAEASTRPSAAACGFSTEGMTDAEVQDKLNANAMLAERKQTRKRKGRGKVANTGEEGEIIDHNNMPEVSEQQTKVETKTKGSRKKARKNKKDVTNTADTTSITSMASASAAAPAAEEPSTAPGVEVAVPEPLGETTEEVATPTGADEFGEPSAEAMAADIAKAEKAAKASRKSSAYHKAALKAKKEGKSPAECKAAGKAVSWIRFVMFYNRCVCDINMLHGKWMHVQSKYQCRQCIHFESHTLRLMLQPAETET